MSTKFYEQNAQDFFDTTFDVDMGALYTPFLDRLTEGAHILDAGCGSGRDTKHFLSLDYQVTAFDASAELVRLATAHTRQPISQMTFQEMSYAATFDGIWACASLLHVPDKDWIDVVGRFCRALKPGGVWYFSFKYGDTARSKDGRFFRDHTENSLKDSLTGTPGLELLSTWRTQDTRKDRENESWLNVMAIRQD